MFTVSENRDILKLPSYKIYREDWPTFEGGVLIAMRDVIKHILLPEKNTFINNQPKTLVAKYRSIFKLYLQCPRCN